MSLRDYKASWQARLGLASTLAALRPQSPHDPVELVSALLPPVSDLHRMGNACGKEEEEVVEREPDGPRTLENPGKLTLVSSSKDSDSGMTKRFVFTAKPAIKGPASFAIGLVCEEQDNKVRMYTPVVVKNGGKHVELLIKKYDVEEKFGVEPEANMSGYIHE
eukprot:COSAG05_NODE_6933_length_879_cov_1.358974_1_plen_162_part_01